MSNEIDTAVEAVVARRSAAPGAIDVEADESSRIARLAARLYAGADGLQRSRMLTGLLRPLGPLGLVAVASGAFAGLLTRLGSNGVGLTVEDVGHFSREQVFELARFVEQVSPQALRRVAGAIADNPFGVSALGVAAAVLLAAAMRARANMPQSVPLRGVGYATR